MFDKNNLTYNLTKGVGEKSVIGRSLPSITVQAGQQHNDDAVIWYMTHCTTAVILIYELKQLIRRRPAYTVPNTLTSCDKVGLCLLQQRQLSVSLHLLFSGAA